MKSILKALLGMPKSIYFNFRYLPFKQACRLPVLLTCGTKLKISTSGKVVINAPIKSGMIHIGFHECAECNHNDDTILYVGPSGSIIFNGAAFIGNGSKIIVRGLLELGNHFAISASSVISCYKHISFGRDIQLSWDCLVMDSDSHSIFNEEGCVINSNKEITFSDNIWIGCRTTILKGALIPDNCVIGANSLVSGSKFEPSTIIAGSPAKSIKKIGGF